MKTIKTSLNEVSKNTRRVFHISSDCDSDYLHVDIIGDGNEFSIAISSTKEVIKQFEKFADLLNFVAEEHLLKKRCHLRFF